MCVGEKLKMTRVTPQEERNQVVRMQSGRGRFSFLFILGVGDVVQKKS
jgi:hypothetical protein